METNVSIDLKPVSSIRGDIMVKLLKLIVEKLEDKTNFDLQCMQEDIENGDILI